MTYAVRYYTKTGNTKRLAEAMAKVLGVEARPISEPVTETVDYLFLGNSYYAFDIDPEVKQFVASLDPAKIGKIVNFGSAAGGQPRCPYRQANRAGSASRRQVPHA